MEDKIINLIIIDDSFYSEEKIISKQRKMGYMAKAARVEDDEDLLEVLVTQTPDLVIYFEGMELITLKQTIECLKKDKRTENTLWLISTRWLFIRMAYRIEISF